ncbi:hypothetical protein SE18_19960 [Herpetosiphon geysericola]|uniref:Uncharacterized protein n=1 Tax=Herpetosiphon geysericola TaxID=70996 RepID=A0A0P6Y986_9CHLR|nr:hypothetical protein SE18_19960 [Herpetosiphon geysericola]
MRDESKSQKSEAKKGELKTMALGYGLGGHNPHNLCQSVAKKYSFVQFVEFVAKKASWLKTSPQHVTILQQIP